MCGFFGMSNLHDIGLAEKAIRKIRHRGPDELGLVKTTHGTLAHARLSIVDQAHSQQPLENKGAFIVYNGEVYNFEQLRAELGGDWKTQGDTEVVLRSIQDLGIETNPNFDGMFAFAVIGEGMVMARDSIGIKPLYYSLGSDSVYFASEMKALMDCPGIIQEFPAGHYWSDSGGFVRYFHLDQYLEAPALLAGFDAEATSQRIRAGLAAAVKKRMIADANVPVGVSLSGGLDSSLITGLAAELKPNLNTFAVGMENGNDLPNARIVAKYFGTRHHEYVYNNEEVINSLSDVIYHMETFDAPLIRSAIPNYFLARLACKHVKVILTGEGADELFGGYEYLEGIEQPDLFQSELWKMVNGLHNTNLQRTDRMTMAFGIEGRVPFLDRDFARFVLSIPAEHKFHTGNGTEKTLLRKAFENLLPKDILERKKEKFSKGAGSSEVLAEHANARITDADFENARRSEPEARLRSKEELFYYRIFREHFGDRIPLEAIGRTRSVTNAELN